MPKDPKASPIQRCPICGAMQPLSARTCGICGARLTGERVTVAASGEGAPARPHFDPALGDDDLFVGDVMTRRSRLALIGCLGLILLLAIGVGAFALGSLRDEGGAGGGAPLAEVEGIRTPRPTAPPTATLRPGPVTLIPTREMPKLATVTPAPPTPTETPTPGPCLQTAGQGDTVLAMAYRCGHREMAVVDLILEINGMTSANELQLGQTLEIPWPTPTPGPGDESPPPTDETSAAGDAEAAAQASVNEFGTPDALATYQDAEPTLRPGQAWHTVRKGETILSIAFDYGTTLETLSQINPEVPFLQCDYGDPAGGPTCSVMIVEGQQIRVPVPLSTLTPTFTPEGTLTPTPTLSPTFNAPYLLSPDNDARFRRDDLVTLRWGGTGTLGPAERYLVRLRDLGTGEEHLATVPTTTYILPGGWQPDDRQRHTFEWTISVVELDGEYNVVREDHITDARRFTWESR